MITKVKICGLKTAEHVNAAIDAGTDYVGFVFFEKSHRNIAPAQAAELRALCPEHVKAVALIVDADDALIASIEKIVKPDYLQLHGNESPARVSEVKRKFGLPVIKAIGIQQASDLSVAQEYEDVADILMFDAKPPKGSEVPGGHGKTFDWKILSGLKLVKPWFLAGGLTPKNVYDAVEITRAPMVDVSSGVEDAHKVKDSGLIRAFIHEAKRL